MKILRKSKTHHIYLVQKVLLQGELSYYIKRTQALLGSLARDIVGSLTCAELSEPDQISVQFVSHLIQLEDFCRHDQSGHIHIIKACNYIVLYHEIYLLGIQPS
jgi:hypothetical protein